MKSRQQLEKRFEALEKQIKASTADVAIDESPEARRVRVAALLDDWPGFLKYYFPNWASSEFAAFHLRGGNAILTSKKKKMFFAWMIARDMAKTTFWQMFAIYLTCRSLYNLHHGYRNVVWWSKTFDQASEMLRAIRLQFEYNQRLLNDFGTFKTVSIWADDKFVTSQGQGISFRALGKGQSPRGTKEDEKRPDLIIGDDFDDDEEVLNDIRLEKSYQWIMGALWPTMDVSAHALFVVLNNKIGERSLMARLYEQADYKETINLLDANGNPTWKRHSKEDCQYMISKMGTLLAEREYFNNPITEGKVFRKDWMRYKALPALNEYLALVAYLDPSFKNKKNSDHKSWVLIGLHRGELHVVKAFCDRASVDEMIEWGYVLDQLVRSGGSACELWMEEVFLQDLLYKDFNAVAQAKGKPLPLNGDKRQKPDKDARIASLSGYFERGNWYFNEAEKDNHHMVNLIYQFTSFQPGHTGIKKDGPDACEGAVFKLMEKVVTNVPATMGKRNKHKNMY